LLLLVRHLLLPAANYVIRSSLSKDSRLFEVLVEELG